MDKLGDLPIDRLGFAVSWQRRRFRLLEVLLLAVTLGAGSAAADRIVLKNGLSLSGNVEVLDSRIIVRSGLRVYHVGTRQLLQPEKEEAPRAMHFVVPQRVNPQTRPLGSARHQVRLEKFDDFGRRMIVLADDFKNEHTIFQGITDVYPSHVVVQGLNRSWRFGLSLSEISSDVLVAVLHKAIDDSLPRERLRVAEFLIQTGRLTEAETALADIRERYAEVASDVEELTGKLNRRLCESALRLLNSAIETGQFERARRLSTGNTGRFTMPADLAPKFRVVERELETLAGRIERAAGILASCSPPEVAEQKGAVTTAQAEIHAQLSPATIARLQPLLDLADQPGTTNEQRLALAMSGWVLGPDLAQKDLAQSVGLWTLREQLRRAVETTNEVEFQILVQELTKAARADLVLQMIPRLPAPPTPAKPGIPYRVEFVTKEFGTLAYQVQLPAEYDRYREYPAVITLHGLETTPEQLLGIWGPIATASGTILIAPEHRLDKTRGYEFSVNEHQVLQAMLSDVRRRLAIDADRLFLSGHEMGGVAAWDFGMSHPDQFAGLIPFLASPQFYCERYRPNLKHLPVYAVEGSLNGANPLATQAQFTHYFEAGLDAIYVEYPGRGREPFPAELPTIFDWLGRQRRQPAPTEIEAVTARHSDRRFYWLEADSFLPGSTVSPRLFDRTSFRPARLQGKVSGQGTVTVTTSGLDGFDLFVPPKLIHLDDPATVIRANNRIVHRGPIEPDIELLLRELRRTGDRKNLFVKKFHIVQ